MDSLGRPCERAIGLNIGKGPSFSCLFRFPSGLSTRKPPSHIAMHTEELAVFYRDPFANRMSNNETARYIEHIYLPACLPACLTYVGICMMQHDACDNARIFQQAQVVHKSRLNLNLLFICFNLNQPASLTSLHKKSISKKKLF